MFNHHGLYSFLPPLLFLPLLLQSPLISLSFSFVSCLCLHLAPETCWLDLVPSFWHLVLPKNVALNPLLVLPFLDYSGSYTNPGPSARWVGWYHKYSLTASEGRSSPETSFTQPQYIRESTFSTMSSKIIFLKAKVHIFIEYFYCSLSFMLYK